MLAQAPSSRAARLSAFSTLAIAIWCGTVASARADAPHTLQFDAASSARMLASLAAVRLAIGASPAPSRCHWCEPGPFDLSVARRVQDGDLQLYGSLGDWGLRLTWLGTLGTALGGGYVEHDGSGRVLRGLEDLAIVGEALMMTAVLTGLIKLSVARRRPDAYLGRDDQAEPSRRNKSFVSGHTSHAAALGAAIATVSFQRGYGFRHVVAIGAGVLSLGVAVLRVASLRHWPSDVIAGWLLGVAVGISMPLLLHPRADGPRDRKALGSSAPLLQIDF